MKLSSGQRTAAVAALVGGGATLLAACLFMGVGAASGRQPVMIPAVAASLMLSSLALPLLSVLYAKRPTLTDWLASWTPVLAGGAVVLSSVSLLGGTQALSRTLQSLVIVGSVAFAYGALATALLTLTRSARAASMASSLCLTAAIAVPFWSGSFLRTGTGVRWGTWLVRMSPSLSSAMPWVSPTSGWAFDPRTSNVLYDIWVGNDVPLVFPTWYSSALSHVLVGVLLLAASNGRALAHSVRAAASRTAE